MAFNVSDLNAVTRELVLGRDGVVDAAIKNEPLLDFMMSNNMMTVDGGNEIRRVVLTDRNDPQWYSKRDNWHTNNKSKRTHAQYQWRHLQVPINLSEVDLRQNNGSESEIVSLLDTERQAMRQALQEALGGGLFSDGSNPGGESTAKQIDGLKAYIGTGSYANLNPSDFPNPSDWKAVSKSVNDSNGLLTKGDIQKRTLTDINTDFGNGQADLAVCNMAVWSKIWELLAPHQQLMEGDVNPGFSSFVWNGNVEFVVDDRAPGSGRGSTDNKIYFLRTEDIELVRHSETPLDISDFKSPIDQPVIVAFINTDIQFVAKQRKFSGELTGIDPAQ